MANAGLPAHKLMEYMGHASITTTMDFYIGLESDFSAVVVKALA